MPLAPPRLQQWARPARSARRGQTTPLLQLYDPGRERRAEQRARPSSCAAARNAEERGLYRDPRLTRWPAGHVCAGDIAPRCVARAHADLVHPYKPIVAHVRRAASRSLRAPASQLPDLTERWAPSPARLGRRPRQVDGADPRRGPGTRRANMHRSAASSTGARARGPLAPGRVGASARRRATGTAEPAVNRDLRSPSRVILDGRIAHRRART